MSRTSMFDLKFVGRVGFHDSPHSPHVKAITRMAQDSKILDIGCSEGYTAAEARKRRGCEVWGMDADKEALERAQKHCVAVFAADFERLLSLPFPEIHFNGILLLDVLEHLARPDRFLALVSRGLRPNTKVWISLPNIARLEYRLHVLRGHFDYEDGGVLSRGHLRFFTLQTARTLIEDAGLQID